MRPDMIHAADQIGGMARIWAQATASYYREAREQGLSAPDSIQLALGWQTATIQTLAFTRPATDGGENAS